MPGTVGDTQICTIHSPCAQAVYDLVGELGHMCENDILTIYHSTS